MIKSKWQEEKRNLVSGNTFNPSLLAVTVKNKEETFAKLIKVFFSHFCHSIKFQKAQAKITDEEEMVFSKTPQL